ncbi:(2Fe-2S)-binding protein [Azospirillum sp. B4]|uniref:(2Fe-2S)-binding protein n=1 Tax=Azospirillum sp. B4 TaxID=95605 RepID=UPI000344F1B5|nr:(2Fe-2S)-binding protein [Azospirillum sp. B4]
MPPIKLTLNGKPWSVDADPDMPLLWAVREIAGKTGSKFGCGAAQCGACTMHVDGQPVRSCSTPIGSIAGSKVTTIEGIAEGPQAKVAKAVQDAWIKLDVVQCGYCQSGQIMSAVALLTDTPKPTDQDIDSAMNGNLCRCSTYVRIRAAIHEAAKALEI